MDIYWAVEKGSVGTEKPLEALHDDDDALCRLCHGLSS